MARTIAAIQQTIWDAKNADATLASITSTSRVATWWLWTWVIAFVMWVQEGLYDLHKTEVSGIITAGRAHTLQWYVTKAKAFQSGVSLPPDTDVYAVVPPVDPTVLIVANAAAIEYPSLVRLKAAKLSGAVLAPLSGGELTALTTYMGRVKDAGVRLQVTSGDADNFQTGCNVYYDPLIIAMDGSRIDTTAPTPVKDAINAFLDALPFNGVFIYNDFVTAIGKVNGVKIFEPLICQANYGSVPYINIKDATPSVYVPDAGYMTLDVSYFDANVNYIAY